MQAKHNTLFVFITPDLDSRYRALAATAVMNCVERYLPKQVLKEYVGVTFMTDELLDILLVGRDKEVADEVKKGWSRNGVCIFAFSGRNVFDLDSNPDFANDLTKHLSDLLTVDAVVQKQFGFGAHQLPRNGFIFRGGENANIRISEVISGTLGFKPCRGGRMPRPGESGEEGAIGEEEEKPNRDLVSG